MPAVVNFLLPVKYLDQSKQRLSGVLTSRQRRQLVLSLLEKNLSTLTAHFSRHSVLVVTPDPSVMEVAQRFGVQVLFEEAEMGLNNAIAAGTRWSLAHGFRTQVVLAPDLFHLDKSELQLLLNDTQLDTTVSICMAKDWGTNALLTTPPDAIPFLYGVHSAKKMLSVARQRGIPCRLMRLPHFLRDVDTPDDLVYLQHEGLYQ